MKKILPILVLILFLFSCQKENKIIKPSSNTYTKLMEYAYFEGQRDCLEGDIRIKNTNDQWSWIKSPWDGHNINYYSYELPYEENFVYINYYINNDSLGNNLTYLK